MEFTLEDLKYTYLQQGKTLVTPQTRRWSKEQWAENESYEKSMIFTKFSIQDKGRGRVFIMKAQDSRTAAKIVEQHNKNVAAVLKVNPGLLGTDNFSISTTNK